MLAPVSYVVIALAGVLCVLAFAFAIRDSLFNDLLLGLSALLELALIVQIVMALTAVGSIDEASEKATFIAYAVSLPFIPLGTSFLAIKEKTRWSMGAVAVGGFAVAVMAARLLQIWHANA